jgi:hypothetical protein
LPTPECSSTRRTGSVRRGRWDAPYARPHPGRQP